MRYSFIISLQLALLLANCSSGKLTTNPTNENIVRITDFGAVGDGNTNSTEAFRRAADYLQEHGGTLIIDSGIYILGKQTLSGRFGAGVSWKASPILHFKDAKKPIAIRGENAILKASDGLRFGSFNPVTGLEDNHRTKGHPSDYYASAYIFINAEGCTSITISGLTIDGNLGKLMMSKPINKGIQLPALGIRLVNNKRAKVKNCYIHHCALDGLYIAWNGLTEKDPEYPHTVDSVMSTYNGRQAFSWIGGNSLTVTNSEFSHTGRAINNGKPVIAEPAAGIDIEIEDGIIKNGNFINCLVSDNAGYGLSTIGHRTKNINFKKVTFIGNTNYAAFPKSEDLNFDSCSFVGAIAGLYGSEDPDKASYFSHCFFTMEGSLSPDGKTFENSSKFYTAQNVVFDHCTFNAGEKRLPLFNQKEITFIDCTFIQNSNNEFRAIATFKGTTHFLMNKNSRINIAESTFQGPVIFNGKKIEDAKMLHQIQHP